MRGGGLGGVVLKGNQDWHEVKKVSCYPERHVYHLKAMGLPDVQTPLKGSWDLVTRVINKVTILIITYNPN